MARSRLTRAFAVLALFLAQAALGLPLAGTVGGAHARSPASSARARHGGPMAGALELAPDAASESSAASTADSHGAGDCHHRGARDVPARAPMPPCGSCPGMPGGPMGAGCPAMAGCNASPAVAHVPLPVAPATVALVNAAARSLAPAAHDFNPDPPPPRA